MVRDRQYHVGDSRRLSDRGKVEQAVAGTVMYL
jgi:hypothetical protein